jgi:hypothetical protein
MNANDISKEIAALEQKSKSAKTAVVKKALDSKIEKLQSELAKITTKSEANLKLSKAKAKVRAMSATAFNDFIEKLSAKQGYSFLKQMSAEEIRRDIQRVAKPVGWRYRGRENMKTPLKRDIKAGKNVYYENRANRADLSRVVRLKEGGSVNETFVVKDGQDTLYLTYIDSTHFYLSNTKSQKGSAFHVAQFKGEKYYNDVLSWLKSYNTKMAKGGFIGKQANLDRNKNGRIDSEDLRMIRENKMAQGGELHRLEESKMAKGGFVGKGEMVWKKLTASAKAKFLYENFTPKITPRSQEILVGKAYNFLPKDVKIVFESKYADVEDYATGGNLKDSDYSASAAGRRTSHKFSTVKMKNGSLYTRRNENQYGKAEGGKTYYEGRANRSDKKKFI